MSMWELVPEWFNLEHGTRFRRDNIQVITPEAKSSKTCLCTMGGQMFVTSHEFKVEDGLLFWRKPNGNESEALSMGRKVQTTED